VIAPLLSFFGLDVRFDQHGVIRFPLCRTVLLARGLQGVAVLTNRTYISRSVRVRGTNLETAFEVAQGICVSSSGSALVPSSVLESLILPDGGFEVIRIRRGPRPSANYAIGAATGKPLLYAPTNEGFFHTYLELLPALKRLSGDFTILIDLDETTSDLELFGLFGLHTLPISEPNLYAHAVTDRYMLKRRSVYPTRRDILLARDTMLPHVSALDRPESLLVTRAGNKNGRQLINQRDIELALRDLNLRVVDPGTMPLREQINLFGNAELIIAPHGAALSHLVVAPSSCLVVELNGDVDVRWHYSKVCWELGLQYRYVLGTSLSQIEFYVDPDLVSRAIGSFVYADLTPTPDPQGTADQTSVT
jgi:hypothetical protein